MRIQFVYCANGFSCWGQRENGDKFAFVYNPYGQISYRTAAAGSPYKSATEQEVAGFAAACTPEYVRAHEVRGEQFGITV